MKLTNRELWNAGALYGDPTKLGARDPGLRRHNAKPEQGVLNAVLAMLRLHPAVAWAARINSGAYKTPDGRFIRFGFPGCPDIVGQMKPAHSGGAGAFLAIECKSDAGRATDEQAAFIDKVKQFGGKAGIARSVDDALAILEG